MTDIPSKHCEEIEITPEMIEAGAEAKSGHDDRFESADEMIARVYRAKVLKAKGDACGAGVDCLKTLAQYTGVMHIRFQSDREDFRSSVGRRFCGRHYSSCWRESSFCCCCLTRHIGRARERRLGKSANVGTALSTIRVAAGL